MNEIVSLTESHVRGAVAIRILSFIVRLADRQRVLKETAAPLYKSGSEKDLLLASGKYDERMCARKFLRELHLVYGFLRGVPLEKIESRCHEERPMERALKTMFRQEFCEFPGFNSDHRKVLTEEFRRWGKGEKQAFFAAKEAARAEAVRAFAG